MDFVAISGALADLGGFALFVLVVAVAAVGIYRQWIVPGWIYRKAEASMDELKAENRELVRTNARLTAQLHSERRRRRTDLADDA